MRRLLTLLQYSSSLVRIKPFLGESAEQRSRERYRRIAITSITAIAAKGFGVLTSIVTVPLTVGYLGVERYGLWMTITSGTSLLAFADFGIGNGLLNALSEAQGRQDGRSPQTYVSSTVILLSVIMVALFLVTLCVYPLVQWHLIYNVVTPLAQYEAGPTTLVMCLAFLVNLPLGAAQRVQIAYQEGYKSYTWTSFGCLLGLIGVLAAIHAHAGLPWLVCSMLAGPVVALALNWYALFGRARPDLAPTLAGFSWPIARSLCRTGMIFMALQMLSLAGAMSDNIIIARVLGASNVSAFAVGQKLFSLTLLTQYFLAPLWPAFGEAMARNDRAWARRALRRAIIISIGLGLATGVPLLIAGQYIIRRWVGSSVVPSQGIIVALFCWSLINCFQGTIATFLNSGALLTKHAKLFTAASVVAVFGKIVACKIAGIEAVVWTGCVAYALIYAIPGARLAYNSLK